mgnify:CR=1 FL=1
MIMIQATEKNFDELLSMEKPLMVDFGAEWCGPCKALAPMVAELAEAYKEQAVIAACDVEENNDIAVRYSIRNIPTVIFFKDGKELEERARVIANQTLKEALKGITIEELSVSQEVLRKIFFNTKD